MRVAAIDLGSNTFLLLIVEVEAGVVKRVLHDECQLVRLGQGVGEAKAFHPDALARADKCLEGFAQTISRYKPQRIRAVATSAARDARNKDDFFTLGKKHGISIEIISGDEEARLSFYGGASDLFSEGDCRVIDVGGGSTEFILGNKAGVLASKSLDLGSVRLNERFVTRHPISESERSDLGHFIRAQISTLPLAILSARGPVVAVAGTPTTLAAVVLKESFNAQKIHGFELELGVMEEWCEKLAKMTVNERAQLPGMEPLRADVIVAGLTILIEATRSLGGSRLLVSTRGVRYGLALEMGQ